MKDVKAFLETHFEDCLSRASSRSGYKKKTTQGIAGPEEPF
jgi:hypothetical protein